MLVQRFEQDIRLKRLGSLNKVYAIDKNLKLCCEGNGNTCRKRVEQMELLAKIDEKNERR
ncbi:hypothetical protein BLOT_007868 [Blomia tropicalis]|nr:hypothetical protein BLOT_007868 [Blomia tropicalis]